MQYDFPPTANPPIDLKNIWLDGYKPIDPLPAYELHHGFDIPKANAPSKKKCDAPVSLFADTLKNEIDGRPILCSDLIDAVIKEGFANGGW